MYEHEDIIFRKLEEHDLDILQSLKAESWGTTHNISIVNRDDQMRWFKSLDQHVHAPKNLALIAHLGGIVSPTTRKIERLLGIFKITNIDYISRSADVAWDTFKSARGKGYGKKIVSGGSKFCIDILNLRRLTAEILSNNVPSVKCAKAALYVHEGTKRQAVHKKGEFIDSEIWAYVDGLHYMNLD